MSELSVLSGLVWGAPWALVLLLAVPVSLWLERRAGSRPGGMAVRGTLVALIALAGGLPRWAPAAEQATVLLVDRSAGPWASGVEALTRDLDPAGRLLTLPFDGSVDLATGLETAAASLPAPGRLVVVAPPATGDTRAIHTAQGLRVRGHRVDGVIVDPAPSRDASEPESTGLDSDPPDMGALDNVALDNVARDRGAADMGALDVAVLAIEVPEHHRRHQPVTLAVDVSATESAPAEISVGWSGQPPVSRRVVLERGVSRHAFSLPVPGGPGAALRADARAEDDTLPQNDTRWAWVTFHPRPQGLVVGDGLGAVALADAWTRSGWATSVAAPDRVSLADVAAADLLAIVDMPADRLGDALMVAIADAVEAGAGALLTAGRQSFTTGGWEGTPLAPILPVELQSPDRGAREPVALLLIVDTSASMGTTAEEPVLSKLDLAREAAFLAVDALATGDITGIVAYSDAPRWVRQLGAIESNEDLLGLESGLSTLSADGGTRILSALELGLPVLAVTDAATRHAVLITDGQDSEPDEPAFIETVRRSREAGVTLSTIAIGDDADTDLLRTMAAVGRGRSHAAQDPQDLPRLTLEESRIVRGRSERRLRVRPVALRPHPAIAGADVGALETLDGYLALELDPAAETVIETPDGDPLLATRPVGAGRVAAWLSDTGEEWARAWPESPPTRRLWAAVGEYLVRYPGHAAAAIETEWTPAGTTVSVDASPFGAVSAVRGTLVVTAASTTHVVDLVPLGNGRFEVALDPTAADLPPGAYAASVTVGAQTGRSGVVIEPPPGAWRLHRPSLLGEVVAAGGGQILPADPLSGDGPGALELWPWLLGLAGALWVVEVGREMRRGGSGG